MNIVRFRAGKPVICDYFCHCRNCTPKHPGDGLTSWLGAAFACAMAVGIFSGWSVL